MTTSNDIFPGNCLTACFTCNTTGATSGAGTAYPSVAHVLTPGF